MKIKGNTQVVIYCDVDCVGSPFDKISTLGYCMFLGGTLSYRGERNKMLLYSI